jgi:hypothetical protein
VSEPSSHPFTGTHRSVRVEPKHRKAPILNRNETLWLMATLVVAVAGIVATVTYAAIALR